MSDRHLANGQCAAVLPNDPSGQHNAGWMCCSLAAGHSGPHRTGYFGAAAHEGDPAWTFDVEAIKRLPSCYVGTPKRVGRDF